MNKSKNAKISDLKKGVEKKEKSSLIVQQKELKPGTKGFLTTIRTIFWIVVCFIIVIGVLQVVKSKQPRIIENIYRTEVNESESNKAKAFAEGFVKDYLTFSTSKRGEYKEKMDKYMNAAVVLGKTEYATGSSEVLNTVVWDVEVIDPNTSNIIVRAEVKVTNDSVTEERYDPNTGERKQYPVEEIKEYFVSVPIVAKDGKVIVNDYPAFVADESKLDEPLASYVGANTVMDEEKQEIEKFLEDFFDVYYTGTEGQIKTFFETDPKLKGMQGEFDFNTIVSLESYKENDVVTNVVVLSVKSPIGAEFNQRYLIEMKKAGDHWVITEIENRGTKTKEE